MKKIVWTIICFLMLIPFVTMAHEGHGLVNTGPAHYLSPEHVLPIVLFVAVAGFFISKKVIKKTCKN